MIISKEIGLLGSNVLIYAADASSSFHSASKTLAEKGITGSFSVCVTPQVLFEFFAVITNPKRVTRPIEPKEAVAEIKKYQKAHRVIKIYPKEDVLERVLRLSKEYLVKAQEIFDLYLVATMLSNNFTKIYTDDKEHFSKFKEIEVLTP